MYHLSARDKQNRNYHCEKSEERFTNFETYPQNEFENVEHLEMSANLLEKSQGLSVENNLMEDWIEELITENSLKRQGIEKAKEIIQSLEIDLERTKKQLFLKETELEKTKVHVNIMQSQLLNQQSQVKRTKNKISQKSLSSSRREKQIQNYIPNFNTISLELFEQFFASYEKAMIELNSLIEKEKQHFLDERYTSKMRTYQNEVQQDLQDLLKINTQKSDIQIHQNQVIGLLQNYQTIIRHYKQYCIQLKTALNQCLYEFQEHLVSIQDNLYQKPSSYIPEELVMIVGKEILEYVEARESDLVENNLEMKEILDRLIHKIRK